MGTPCYVIKERAVPLVLGSLALRGFTVRVWQPSAQAIPEQSDTPNEESDGSYNYIVEKMNATIIISFGRKDEGQATLTVVKYKCSTRIARPVQTEIEQLILELGGVPIGNGAG